jgi:hypothetical protein
MYQVGVPQEKTPADPRASPDEPTYPHRLPEKAAPAEAILCGHLTSE